MTVIKCQKKSGAYGEAWWRGGGAGGVESPGEQKISRRNWTPWVKIMSPQGKRMIREISIYKKIITHQVGPVFST